MNKVFVISKFSRNPYDGVEVDTTSSSYDFAGLSPFHLNAEKYGAKCFENLWQFSKLYSQHANPEGNPTSEFWEWRLRGFSNPRPIRYPMGKGAIPLCSFWEGNKLGYIEARKRIYAPIYAELVQKTQAFARLKKIFDEQDLVLRDYDGYDYVELGRNLVDVIKDPTRKCGHAFVLAMILTGVLEECLR
ncbi:MAG: hypothetical protein PXY39_02950 [archaeon]|nr:hypothetical protein [archaeon]